MLTEQRTLPFNCTPILRAGEPYRATYWRYIAERQAIYHRRFVLKMPQPWTNDEVLQKYSFTNVYRELDRGTIHFLTTALPVIRCCDPAMQAWWVLVYRFFNRPETWDNVLSQYCEIYQGEMNYERIAKMFGEVRNWGDKYAVPVWTGSYMVCAYASSPGYDKIDKVRRFCTKVWEHIDQLYALTYIVTGTEEFHAALTDFDGIGPFNAYEVLSDLLYFWKPLLSRGFTENDWANPGPGAERGLRLIYGSDEKYSRKRMQEMMRELEQEQNFAWGELELPWADVCLPNTPRLSMRNIEHNLCELSKYARGTTKGKFIVRTPNG